MSLSIDVYSTKARDVVVDQIHQTVIEHSGGPGVFISRVLETCGVLGQLFAGPTVEVRIDVSPQGEGGTISELAQNQPIQKKDRGAYAVCSTVLNEWNPMLIAGAYDNLYLDVQGFVRAPGVMGKKQVWEDFQGEWITNVRCVKATAEEVGFLPRESVEDQKTRLLLVTKGAEGVDVYSKGHCIAFSPPRIVKAPDTIGAGDTFFAHVVAGLVCGENLDVVVNKALEQTCCFLETKTKTS